MIGFISCSKKTIPQATQIKQKELSGKDLQNYNYLFSEALKEKIFGNIQKAVTYYTQCLKINPQSDASMYELSNLYSMAGEYKLGIRYGRMAVKADPDNIWYQLNLANLYHTVEMNDSSIAVYENIREKYPERTDLYFNLGNIYKESGEFKKALKVFNDIEEQYGFQPNIALMREEIYERQGDFSKAEKETNRLIKTFPEDMKYRVLLAELYFKQDKNQDAEAVYEYIEKTEPGNSMALMSRISYYRKINNYKEAFRLIDTVIVREKIHQEAKIQLMISLLTNPEEVNKYADDIYKRVEDLKNKYPGETRYYALLGDFYVKTENYQKAAEEFKAFIEKDQTNYRVWEQLLYIENMLGNTEELYLLSKNAMSLFRTAPIVYFFNGIACTELKKYDEALGVLQKGITFAGDNRELIMQYYSLLGETYKNLGKNELSDQAFENALEIDPKNLLVLNNYSYYLSLRDQNLKKALKMSSVTIKAEPNNSTYLDTYGWILYKLKKYPEALKYLKKAMENDSDPSGEILDHYGDALSKMGKNDEAVKYWEKALKYSEKKMELQKKIDNVKK
jgi:tetratricopeptide (TPR) repeat protein